MSRSAKLMLGIGILVATALLCVLTASSIGFTVYLVIFAGIALAIMVFRLPVPQTTTTVLSSPMKTQQVLPKQEEKLLPLQQEVQTNPRSYEALTTLGYAQHNFGLHDDALASANKALSLNKKYARAWLVRGAALSTMEGKEDDALAACEEALALEPNNVDALYYKGRIFVFLEREKDAHRVFDRVLQLEPTYKAALVTKGTLYLAAEDFNSDVFAGALDVASRLIFLYPQDAVGWRMQGEAYVFQGEREGGNEEFEKANELLGIAVASFNKALELDPTDSNTYLLKASPFVTIGNYSEALEALDQGLNIDPTNTRLREAKADIVQKRTKETTTKIAGTAGRMALGGGVGLAKGSARVGKMFWDEVFKS